MSSVSIIVPAHDAEHWLSEQLESLALASAAQELLEVIVVDNRSSDATAAIAHRFRELPVRIVKAEDGRGAAYARNVGASHAIGDVLLFCDADDRVDRRWIATMRAAAESFDVFGGSLDFAALDPLEHFPQLALPADLDFIPWFIAANIGMKRSVWSALGGWNEAYTAAEEIEFCWRASLAGFRLGTVTDAVVYYRPRVSARSAARQGFMWGKAAPRLAADFRAYGFRRRPIRAYFRDCRRLAAGVPRLRSAGARRDWCRLAGLLFGRVAGSIRYRALLL